MNECGTTVSVIQDFTTEGAEAVGNISGNAFSVFPNPVPEILMISFRQPVEEILYATMSTPSGEQCMHQKILPGSGSTELKVAGLPAGIYFLKISSAVGAVVLKVIVQ